MNEKRTIVSYFDKFRYEILAKLNCSQVGEAGRGLLAVQFRETRGSVPVSRLVKRDKPKASPMTRWLAA